MTPRELIEEHTAFLGVYRARISRARQVKKTFVEMLIPLAAELARAEKAILDLEFEYETADGIIEQYETKLKDTTRTISDLIAGGKVFKDRPTRKKPGRLNKLMRLRKKLNKLLEEDPELAEYLDSLEEE